MSLSTDSGAQGRPGQPGQPGVPYGGSAGVVGGMPSGGSSYGGSSYSGTSYGTTSGGRRAARTPDGGNRRRLPGFGLLGPRRDSHLLGATELAALSLPLGDDGVVIGADATTGEPSVIGLFRPTPYEVVLVGGAWAARLLALRAAATGARVAVETARADLWAPLAQAAGGGQPCVTVHQVGRIGPQGPSVSAPVLVVRDCGARPPRSRLASSPWQTTLTLLPFVAPNADRLLSAADLVGVQRISPDEAAAVARALALPAADTQALPALPDNAALWSARGNRRYVVAQPVAAEEQLLGPARRVD